jgi:hypothetical protein
MPAYDGFISTRASAVRGGRARRLRTSETLAERLTTGETEDIAERLPVQLGSCLKGAGLFEDLRAELPHDLDPLLGDALHKPARPPAGWNATSPIVSRRTAQRGDGRRTAALWSGRAGTDLGHAEHVGRGRQADGPAVVHDQQAAQVAA